MYTDRIAALKAEKLIEAKARGINMRDIEFSPKLEWRDVDGELKLTTERRHRSGKLTIYINALLLERDWDESEHPRDEDGKFTFSGGGEDEGGGGEQSIPEHLQHLDAFDKGSTYKTHDREKDLTKLQQRELKADLKSVEKFAKDSKIDLELNYDVWEITSSVEVKWIENKSGEKGRARQVMQRLNELADKWDLQLFGRPRLGNLKLIDYYKQLGWQISPEQEEAAKLDLYHNPKSTVLGMSPFMWRDPKPKKKAAPVAGSGIVC